MPDDRSDDPLARTATAPGAQKSAAGGDDGDGPKLEGTLGRYRLERELGVGGMGVVHAAFDPDLERRVALKVLRKLGGGDEARQRLLREARALARLTHPNVVTVHEVGSANGRDYVAMELIEGETLADWLKAETRSEEDIVGAFAAAGRGLAAAHAAGLVHRDFKPHNVLRRKDGRIVVTDFGLARGVEVAVELQATVKLTKDGKVSSDSAPGSLSGLTETGSVLGTPAYMAPEQWTGENVGPAADQFAFCVALWEALAGERPFRGATLEALRNEVTRGPSELDDSKLPRRLRGPLKRGLDPDPARRWPSMDALLLAIARGERPARGVVMMIGSSAVVAAAIAYVAIDTDDKPQAAAPTCEAPVLDPAVVWSPAIANEVRDKSSTDVMRRFDALIGSWQSARSVACGLDTPMRARRLSCLDGVIVRLDAVRKASVRAKPTLDLVGHRLIDPGICNVDDPPRLPTRLSDAAAQAIALIFRPDETDLDDKAEAEVLKAAGDDKCARGFARMARAFGDDEKDARDAAEEVLQLAEACGDDRMRADALVGLLALQITVFLDPKLQKALAAAEAAVRRVSQPDLVARLDVIKARIAAASSRWDDQLKLAESAIRGFGEQMPKARLAAVQTKVAALMARQKVGDVKAARDELAHWRAEAERLKNPHILLDFDELDVSLQWQSGDVAGANARFPALYERRQKLRKKPPEGGFTVEGVVVDPAGKPVANALVAAGKVVAADSVSIGYLGGFSDTRITRTDAQGRFKLDHVDKESIIVADHDGLRSRARAAKPSERVVLQKTAKISGRVADDDPHELNVFVTGGDASSSQMYQMLAPVRSDGTFEIDHAPIGRLRIGVAVGAGEASQSVNVQEIVVGPQGRADVEVRRAQARKLRVVVRSSVAVPLAGAQVFVVAGSVNIKTVKDLQMILQAPGAAIELARAMTGETPPELKLVPGDLVATFTSAPTGVASACAVGLSGDFADPAFRDKVQKHIDQLEVRCVPVSPDAKIATVEVPPMKRLD